LGDECVISSFIRGSETLEKEAVCLINLPCRVRQPK
jgi:hypothetical protein